MCRLLGMAAPSHTPIRWALSSAANSLERQSARHPDGWGLGYYEEGRPRLRKRSFPAFADGDYRTTLEGSEADHVVAHIRRATVGVREPRNNHPFRCGPWIFAHNGTISQVDVVRDEILDFLPDEIRENIGGETDSELLFHLLMAHLLRQEGTLDADLEAAAAAARRTVSHVRELDERHGARDPSEMNMLLTNGDGFVATRYGQGLYLLDSAEAGDANVSTSALGLEGSVAVASERVANRTRWSEVPRESLVLLRHGEPASVEPLRPRVVA